MSAEDLDNYETNAELALYKEYRDVIKLFTYVVETERRFYLANKVDFNVRSAGQDVYFDVRLTDACHKTLKWASSAGSFKISALVIIFWI